MSFYRPESDAAVPDVYGRRAVILTPEQEAQLRKGYVLTPSNINPWFGTWATGVFTGEQLRELRRLGIDPETVDRMEVRVRARAREWSWNPVDPAPIRLVTCPIIGQQRGRIIVIAPAGSKQRVWPGGHLTRPASAVAGHRLRSGRL